MSREHLWAVLGRSRVELNFSGRLQASLEQTIQDAGYHLDPDEIEIVRHELDKMQAAPAPFPTALDLEFQREKMKERFSAQVQRANDLGMYSVEILKNTLNNAAKTYKRINWMNTAMFVAGIALFLVAAIYGILSHEKIYSLVFGGLGAASFVALFLLGPIDKTQAALSNLIQAEVAFMNYFEQLGFWEMLAGTPKGNPPTPDPENIEKASVNLQMRATETVRLLQTYLETPPDKRRGQATKRVKNK
jgi:ABC-type multidrug transport system fused ATPase/permease subunit